MKLLNYYYDDTTRYLLMEFSTKEDGNDYYRSLELEHDDIIYYSPDIVNDNDLQHITKSFIIDLLNEYLKDNELPEQLLL